MHGTIVQARSSEDSGLQVFRAILSHTTTQGGMEMPPDEGIELPPDEMMLEDRMATPPDEMPPDEQTDGD